MNIMWIPLESGSQRPALGASDGRPIRPLNLAHSDPATSTSEASTLERVRLRAAVTGRAATG